MTELTEFQSQVFEVIKSEPNPISLSNLATKFEIPDDEMMKHLMHLIENDLIGTEIKQSKLDDTIFYRVVWAKEVVCSEEILIASKGFSSLECFPNTYYDLPEQKP